MEAVLSRALAISIPTDYISKFHHYLALSAFIVCRLVTMAILIGWIWFLVVILIDISPVIIRVAEYLVLLFGLFFSFLRGCEANWPLKLASWKLIVLGIYFCNTCCRTFPEGSCHLQPHRPFELEVPVSTGAQVVVPGNVHKEAALLHAQLWFHLQPEPRERWLPGLWIRVKCEQHPRTCVSLLITPKTLPLPSRLIPWGPAPCWAV